MTTGLTKNQRNRLKKKKLRLAASKSPPVLATTVRSHEMEVSPTTDVEAMDEVPLIEIDYVSTSSTLVTEALAQLVPEEEAASDDAMAIASEFSRIFAAFTTPEVLCHQMDTTLVTTSDMLESEAAALVAMEAEEDTPMNVLSKKKRKLQKRLSVAELKQLVTRSDVVEAHDVTSSNPRLLVALKAARNTVPVPSHWCHKRKYLQGKRGVEKLPFALPEFITATGIGDIRSAAVELEESKKASQKNRSKTAPKMGRVDIDYQVLHDAFFRYQTKPTMGRFGEVYYEGKEFEVNVKAKNPGVLSDALKAALGMTHNTTLPPPWLLHMQRYGPPPAYPKLKIAGLNAPIPEGCCFGYHPGGWGKPPVDANGVPVYGNVFKESGTNSEDKNAALALRNVVTYGEDQSLMGKSIGTTPWGAIEEVEHVEDPESDEESDDAAEDPSPDMMEDPLHLEAMMTTDFLAGSASVASTMEGVELRKETSVAPALYTILPETTVPMEASALYGSSHGYNLTHETVPEETKTTEDSQEDDTHETLARHGKRKPVTSGTLSEKATKKYKDFKF